MAHSSNFLLKWLRYSLEFLLLLLISLIAALLPWSWSWRIGRGLGWFVSRVVPVRAKVINRNLELAFPELSLKARLDLAHQCYMHWGESFVCTLKLWFLSKAKISQLVDAPEMEALIKESQRTGRPIIYFTGHFGSWEMAGRFEVDFAGTGASIYRIQKNPLSEWFLTGIRQRRGMRLIGSRLGMGAFLKGLEETHCLAVVGDQYKVNNATEIEFFGRPSPTPKGAAVLTYRSEAQLVFLASFQHRGRFRIKVKAIPYEKPDGMDDEWVHDLIQHLSLELEEVIREAPDQYFWFHKRWRGPKRSLA